MRFVDCNWGTHAEDHYGYWHYPGTGCMLYLVNSFLLKIVDVNNNPIEDATVVLEDKNGLEIFSYTTNADGYPAEESGTVSSTTASTLVDNTKSWTGNQWWFREVYITSGTGIGQRRIIKKGNTGTELQVAWDWDTTPNDTSKYIIIPYVNTKKVEPITPDYAGYIYSTVTDYNDFRLTITYAGIDYEMPMTINKKTDCQVTLDPAGTLSTILTGINDIKGTDFVKDTHSLVNIVKDYLKNILWRST